MVSNPSYQMELDSKMGFMVILERFKYRSPTFFPEMENETFSSILWQSSESYSPTKVCSYFPFQGIIRRRPGRKRWMVTSQKFPNSQTSSKSQVVKEKPHRLLPIPASLKWKTSHFFQIHRHFDYRTASNTRSVHDSC